jgi:hypothetical protein
VLLTELIPRRWITALVGRVMRRTLASRSKGQ